MKYMRTDYRPHERIQASTGCPADGRGLRFTANPAGERNAEYHHYAGKPRFQQPRCLHVSQEGTAPPPKVQAVDTTAAGDTFNAALAGLADGRSTEGKIVFANMASALAVLRVGAQDSSIV